MPPVRRLRFSALQRAEIAEIPPDFDFHNVWIVGFSALQRAEIAEIKTLMACRLGCSCFSALQRAEIAEIVGRYHIFRRVYGFSALQRAEIAEIDHTARVGARTGLFQCSSTSRNC